MEIPYEGSSLTQAVDTWTLKHLRRRHMLSVLFLLFWGEGGDGGRGGGGEGRRGGVPRASKRPSLRNIP